MAFHANCLLKTVCLKCQSPFSGEKKNISLSSAAHIVIQVKAEIMKEF